MPVKVVVTYHWHLDPHEVVAFLSERGADDFTKIEIEIDDKEVK